MNIWAFLDLISIICCVVVAVLVYSRNPKEVHNRSFSKMCAGLVAWSFIQLGFALSRSAEEAARWKTLTAVWPFIILATLIFSLQFTEHGRFVKSLWFKGFVVIPAFILSILEATDHLTFGDPIKLSVGWKVAMAPFSPFSMLGITWFTASMFLIIFSVTRYVFTTRDAQKRSHVKFFFYAIFVVGVTNTFDQITFFCYLGIPNLNPIGIAIGSAFVAYGMVKHKLFSLTPMTAAESILSTMDDMLLLVDARGKILTANNAVFDSLGYREAELIGQDASTLFVKHLPWLVDIHSGDEYPPKKVTDVEVFFNKKNTLTVPVSLSGTAICDQSDNVQGVILIARDITARKRAEQEKAELMEMYRQSQKLESIGRLAGGVAHDMNNILGAIMASALVVKEEVPPASDLSDGIDNILSACYRGRDLTRNLLGFARKGKFVKSDILINHVVTDTVAILRRTVSKNVSIKTTLASDLTTFEGDRGQIQSLLMNICINAVDAITSAGEVSLETRRIELDEKRCAILGGIKPGSYIQLKVVDTGVGMDEDTLKNAFEPFFTTKPIGKGTGLGLAMAYGVTINHGGAIRIYSELGRGTTVTVYFPSTDKPIPKLADTTHEEITADHRTKQGDSGCTGVLLVDDEPLFQSSAKRLLHKLGYQVFVADSGYKALEIYYKNRASISIILLDMLMPGMDGKDVFYKLKDINPEIKVLIISGFDKDENVDQLLSQGANGYLQKPFNMQALSRELENVARA